MKTYIDWVGVSGHLFRVKMVVGVGEARWRFLIGKCEWVGVSRGDHSFKHNSLLNRKPETTLPEQNVRKSYIIQIFFNLSCCFKSDPFSKSKMSK